MTPREKLELLRSYRAAGGTGSYVSLLKEAKEYADGEPKKKLPELPSFNMQQVSDNTQMQYPVETDVFAKEAAIARGQEIRLKEKEEALKKHYNQSGLVGLKRKPTEEEIKYQAKKAIEYNDKLSNDPVGTIGPDLALAVIPELMMLKGPQQVISRGLNKINPFKSYNPWNESNYFLKFGNYEILPKPNPTAHYRNIGGKEGYLDIIKRGEVAPPVHKPIPKTASLKERVTLFPKQYSRAFYAGQGKFSPALRYKGPYAVEANIPMNNGFGGNWGYAPNPNKLGFKNVPTFHPEVRLLKQYRIPKTEKVLFQKELPKIDSKFKSEIDWAKWNRDTPKHKVLIDEYNAIEESTKKAGTWMKNPDGSAFQGTPEQFVQQQSSWFKKAFPQGSGISYRGDLSNLSEIKSQQELGKEALKRKYNLTDKDTEALEKLWERSKDKLNSGKYTTNDYEAALKYAKGDKNKVLHLYTDIRNPKYTDTGESFRVLEKDRQKLLSEGYDALITKPSNFYPEGENVLLKNNQIKSAVGNVGFYDMINPNIYKALLPVGLGTGLYNKTTNN